MSQNIMTKIADIDKILYVKIYTKQNINFYLTKDKVQA